MKKKDEENTMWIADQWKDYEVLDTSNGEKLERWGKYLLVRPDPQVIWDTAAANGNSLTFPSSGPFIIRI